MQDWNQILASARNPITQKPAECAERYRHSLRQRARGCSSMSLGRSPYSSDVQGRCLYPTVA